MRTAFKAVVLAGTSLAMALGMQGPCSNPADFVRLENSKRLEAAVELDRTEYMPNEIMVITISLRNATGQALEVFDPWQLGSMMFKVTGGALMDPEGEMPMRIGASCSGMSIVVQPGETVRRQFRSNQPMAWQPPLLRALTRSAPNALGDYVLTAIYQGRRFTAAFRMVRPEVQTRATVKLAQPGVMQNPTGQTEEYDQFVCAFVLAAGGKRYVGLEARPNATTQCGGPYDRIAEAALDATNLALSEDASGNIQVRWDQEFYSKPGCSPNPHKICTVTVSKDRTTISPRQCLPVLCRWR